jgi:hypothetical protein
MNELERLGDNVKSFSHETHEMHENMNIFVSLLNLFTLSQTD